jgi:hypothetical protein
MARAGDDDGMPSAQQARAAIDPLVERSRPVLAGAGRVLRYVGRLVEVAALSGVVGAALLTLGLVRVAGWWGLLGLAAGILPWRGWLVGHHAVVGSGLLADPGRVAAVARESAGQGRQWLEHVADLRAAGRGRRAGPLARAVVGTGRSVWSILSPDIEGASNLRELAIWPKTVSGLACAAACPILLLIGLVAALASLI